MFNCGIPFCVLHRVDNTLSIASLRVRCHPYLTTTEEHAPLLSCCCYGFLARAQCGFSMCVIFWGVAKIILTGHVFFVSCRGVSGWLGRINSYRACFFSAFCLNRCVCCLNSCVFHAAAYVLRICIHFSCSVSLAPCVSHMQFFLS